MALTQSASKGLIPAGFQELRKTSEDEILWLPGDPGVTFYKGDMVAMSNGVLIAATDSTVGCGRVVRTTTCPALATAFPAVGAFDATSNSGVHATLVPVKIDIPAGVPVMLATFKNHADDATLDAYTAATPSITLTTALGGDDDPNGGLVYVYSGPGAGQLNVIEDYANGTKIATMTRAFGVAVTAASSVIVLEGEGGGAARGVGFLGRFDIADKDEADMADGADNGEYIVYMDMLNAHKYLANLTLLCVKRSHIFG